MSIDSIIMIGATLAANLALMEWEKRRFRKEVFEEINLRDDKKKGRYIFVIGIEDFEYDRDLLETVFNRIGNPNAIYEFEKDALENMPPEACVYVVDDKLSQSDGRQLLKAIMKRNRDNFFILNTGIQNDVVLSEYVKMRVDRFVYKGNVDHEKNLESAIREGISIVANR